MKHILFIITSLKSSNTGYGGHYYSILTYINELKSYYKITVFHYSELIETVIDISLPKEVQYIRKSTFCNLSIKKLCPNLVVFFGASGTLTHWIKLKAIYYKIPVVHVKAGGPSPKGFSLYYDHIICFSEENFNWYKTKYLYRNISKIGFLPNRITRMPPNILRLKNFNYIKHDAINLLRISRINHHFLESFVKTINLHKKLEDNNINVNTILIGVPSHKNAVDLLENKIHKERNIVLLSDEKYTNNARDWIPLFDIITGIGRGFMEAASNKKFVLGFTNAYKIPVVVDKTNYEQFKKLNFSLRNNWKNKHEEDEFNKIMDVINDNNKRKVLESYLYQKFINDYDSRKIAKFFYLNEFKPKAKLTILIKDTSQVLYLTLIKSVLKIIKSFKIKQQCQTETKKKFFFL